MLVHGANDDHPPTRPRNLRARESGTSDGLPSANTCNDASVGSSSDQQFEKASFRLALLKFASLTPSDLSTFGPEDSLVDLVPYGPAQIPMTLRDLLELSPEEHLGEHLIHAYLDVLRLLFPDVRIFSSDEVIDIHNASTPVQNRTECFASQLGKDDKRILLPLKLRITWAFVYIEATDALATI